MGAFPNVSDHRYRQHFTLTPALSLKGEGELKEPEHNNTWAASEKSHPMVGVRCPAPWLAWGRTSLTGQPLREFRRDSIRAAAGFSMA